MAKAKAKAIAKAPAKAKRQPSGEVLTLAQRLERLVRDGKHKDECYLGAPISEAKVAKFEAEHGIELPADFRAFILAAGDNAAGPGYGLMGLADAMKRRGPGIYGLADPFPAPLSTADHLDFNVGGILPIQYDGCDYYTGLVVTGKERGEVWIRIDDRPGWLPMMQADGEPIGPDGLPSYLRGDDGARARKLRDRSLLPKNKKLRLDFTTFYSDWLHDCEKSAT